MSNSLLELLLAPV